MDKAVSCCHVIGDCSTLQVCNGTSLKSDCITWWVKCNACGKITEACLTKEEAIKRAQSEWWFSDATFFDGEIDLVENNDVKLTFDNVCKYVPDIMLTVFDEDDNEIDTEEAVPDGCYCYCTNCGNPMMTGELGWFDESKGPHGGIIYIPRFSFCPYCGAAVEK